MTYEMTEPGFVVVWESDFKAGVVYGPIEPEAIQDFIDAYPDDDFDDVVGYSPSELAAHLGELFVREDSPHDSKGNYTFYVNDPASIGDNNMLSLYKLTVMPIEEPRQTPIEAADFTVRLYNNLKRNHIDTLEQLADLAIEDLFDIRNLGVKQVSEMQAALYARGMDFRSQKIGIQVHMVAAARGQEWDWEFEDVNPETGLYRRRPTINFSTDLIHVRDDGHTVWSVLSAGDYLKGTP